ncbi:MAG TPA: hypothetical protein VFG42_02500 [Baekduia sp.]|uniref:hypothetical protein n=1 Tax=Baekduia sp. TaxID=2600305 RepID=UPI002D7768A2|nr:hypothetical protein [Baekduia sp.]HET6505637.1 hypothetical protein [Baekduia sp.]
MRAPLTAAFRGGLICLSVVPFALVGPAVLSAYRAAHRETPAAATARPASAARWPAPRDASPFRPLNTPRHNQR